MKLFLFILLFYLNFTNVYAIDSKANQAIVMDYNTGEVLFAKNENEIVPPASLTKIMTVYVVFDRLKNSSLSINDTCLISAKAYRMGGSKTFLEIDERVTAPYFGKSSASEFYTFISSATYLKNINHPTLMLNSLDDPLSPPACFPSDEDLSSPNLYFFKTLKGGHVSFISRDISSWLEKQIIRWFMHNLDLS